MTLDELLITGLLIGCDEKCKLCEICRADYVNRKANYAIFF